MPRECQQPRGPQNTPPPVTEGQVGLGPAGSRKPCPQTSKTLLPSTLRTPSNAHPDLQETPVSWWLEKSTDQQGADRSPSPSSSHRH